MTSRLVRVNLLPSAPPFASSRCSIKPLRTDSIVTMQWLEKIWEDFSSESFPFDRIFGIAGAQKEQTLSGNNPLFIVQTSADIAMWDNLPIGQHETHQNRLQRIIELAKQQNSSAAKVVVFGVFVDRVVSVLGHVHTFEQLSAALKSADVSLLPYIKVPLFYRVHAKHQYNDNSIIALLVAAEDPFCNDFRFALAALMRIWQAVNGRANFPISPQRWSIWQTANVAACLYLLSRLKMPPERRTLLYAFLQSKEIAHLLETITFQSLPNIGEEESEAEHFPNQNRVFETGARALFFQNGRSLNLMMQELLQSSK